MDHWGDPWADNANDKSPTKNAVTSPQPPSFTFAPVPLNGFVDDAGWGNNDADGFGDWTTSDVGNAASIDVLSTAAGAPDPGSARWDAVRHEEREEDALKWEESASSSPRDLEKVDSEPSESSTVSQLDGAVKQHMVEGPTQTQTDIESSVRSSTSPSETSRNELPVESPRTSVEDERILSEDIALSEAPIIAADAPTTVAHPESSVKMQEGEGHVGKASVYEISAEQTAETSDAIDTSSDSSDSQSALHLAGDLPIPPKTSPASNLVQTHTGSKHFVSDAALLAQLFPPSGETEKQLDEHDDPIFSTSARKAWYRLTRKQTMREFNHGDNDDNYIRVTWTNSHVRTEVHKVVSRWAREDRISGTGPGARASFYWDTPAPAEHKAPFGHSRTQSSVPATKTALPARQSLPPLAMNQSAAFDWSTSASADPWKLESPSQQSTSASLTPKHPTVARLQRQEGRAVSVDLTPRRSEQLTHKRTVTVSHTAPETTTMAKPISSVIARPSAGGGESRASLNELDSPSNSTSGVAADQFDDDDDWGEMVQTPTLAKPQQLDPFSQPFESELTVLAPPVPESSLNTGVEARSVEPVSAAPVVRLQSTISPTSALFKANSFIPLNAEKGPIGPGILKPGNRSVRVHPDKKPEIGIPEKIEVETSPDSPTAALKADQSCEKGNTTPCTQSDSVPSLSTPDLNEPTLTEDASCIPPAHPDTHIQASTDPWADADFSFFESSLPASVTQQPPQTQDPSDPFSFFDTPNTSSVPPTSESISRSTSRNSTPQILQPSTSATSSVQRRKAEEDQKIHDIINGLPDLSYMLRQ